MVLGKKVDIFDREWGRNLARREGQKCPALFPIKRYVVGIHLCCNRFFLLV